jgi:hypothetical protein
MPLSYELPTPKLPSKLPWSLPTEYQSISRSKLPKLVSHNMVHLDFRCMAWLTAETATSTTSLSPAASTGPPTSKRRSVGGRNRGTRTSDAAAHDRHACSHDVATCRSPNAATPSDSLWIHEQRCLLSSDLREGDRFLRKDARRLVWEFSPRFLRKGKGERESFSRE